MKTIEQLVAEVIKREGGYVNHPVDRGGATCWGITVAVARANGFTGDMRALTQAQAAAIYTKLYWTRPGLDLVAVRAPLLAEELFDTAVNMGPGAAATFLQRALNALNRGATDYPDLVLDGAIGARSIAALDAFLKVRGKRGEGVLVKAVEGLQAARYLSIAETDRSQEAFLFGWLDHRIGNVQVPA